MTYRTMANTIHAILESRSFTPVINDKVEEPLEKDDPDTLVADTTVNYPPNNHDRLDDVVSKDMERMKAHLKYSMRHQHKHKIIDNT